MFVFIGSVHGRCVSFRIPIKPNVDPGCVNKFHLIDLEVQVHQSNYLSSFQIIKNRRIILKFSIIPKRTILPLTSLKLNIAPENGFLEDYFPFEMAPFLGDMGTWDMLVSGNWPKKSLPAVCCQEVVRARLDIQEGEEICISYLSEVRRIRGYMMAISKDAGSHP